MEAQDWRRPYRDVDATGRLGRLRHEPVLWNDHLVWLGTDEVLWMPLGRIAGMHSRANAEFSTQPFEMRREPLTLNADVRWHEDRTHGEQRQAYLMAELRDDQGRMFEGYEKERCVFQDRDGIRLPLIWDGRDGTERAGETVSLRFFFRDATVYGVR